MLVFLNAAALSGNVLPLDLSGESRSDQNKGAVPSVGGSEDSAIRNSTIGAPLLSLSLTTTLNYCDDAPSVTFWTHYYQGLGGRWRLDEWGGPDGKTLTGSTRFDGLTKYEYEEGLGWYSSVRRSGTVPYSPAPKPAMYAYNPGMQHAVQETGEPRGKRVVHGKSANVYEVSRRNAARVKGSCSALLAVAEGASVDVREQLAIDQETNVAVEYTKLLGQSNFVEMSQQVKEVHLDAPTNPAFYQPETTN